MKVFVFVFLLVCILKLGSYDSQTIRAGGIWDVFFFFFLLVLYFEVGDAAYDSQTIRAGAIWDVFQVVGLWISSSVVLHHNPLWWLTCLCPVPLALYLITSPPNLKTRRFKVPPLNGWLLPDSLLGNKTAVNGMSGQTCDVDQVSDVWMKNRSLYAKYPKGTENMIAAIYFWPPWPRPLTYTVAVD